MAVASGTTSGSGSPTTTEGGRPMPLQSSRGRPLPPPNYATESTTKALKPTATSDVAHAREMSGDPASRRVPGESAVVGGGMTASRGSSCLPVGRSRIPRSSSPVRTPPPLRAMTLSCSHHLREMARGRATNHHHHHHHRNRTDRMRSDAAAHFYRRWRPIGTGGGRRVTRTMENFQGQRRMKSFKAILWVTTPIRPLMGTRRLTLQYSILAMPSSRPKARAIVTISKEGGHLCPRRKSLSSNAVLHPPRKMRGRPPLLPHTSQDPRGTVPLVGLRRTGHANYVPSVIPIVGRNARRVAFVVIRPWALTMMER